MPLGIIVCNLVFGTVKEIVWQQHYGDNKVVGLRF